jgi:L-aspartate oxidase
VDLKADFVIVGSGIAGLRAAVELSTAGDILVITKADPNESNTEYAQGGIAAAIGPDDSPSLHAADTVRAGDGLCDTESVRILTEEGPRYTLELLDWGARFDLDDRGRPALASEGAHSVRRVLHARDATGREIGRVLWNRASQQARIRVLKNTLATSAIIESGRCAGVEFIDDRGQRGRVRARASLLATGGAGQVFQETTNPAIATGDGVALAYRAGARITDTEFVQFHPTVLHVANAPRFLLSEALRGEGAHLVNGAGEPFMLNYHPLGDLAPRDVVARSIIREADRVAGAVYLSLKHLNPHEVHERFPMIAGTLSTYGFDLARDPLPVGPAAHYLMGGVETDTDGRTSIPGLFAAGEVACTRVHGANRLASNSLLEGLVFGARAGRAMTGPESAAMLMPPVLRNVASRSSPPAADGLLGEAEVRSLMWRCVGLFRDRNSLEISVGRLEAQEKRVEADLADRLPLDHQQWRLANLSTVGMLIARAALRREESRGGHFRTDFPTRDDLNWKTHITDIIQRS